MRSLLPWCTPFAVVCFTCSAACQNSGDTSSSAASRQGAAQPGSGDGSASSATDPAPSGNASASGQSDAGGSGRDPDHLRELLADVAEEKACDYLEGRYLALSAKSGTSFRGGKKATVGSLWIDSCQMDRIAPEKVRISLKGRGWKWIDRESEKLLADFEVNQYLRFKVDAEVPGTLDAEYAPDDHLLSIWVKPTDRATTRFIPTSGVHVDEEGLWSEIVGGAASVFGKSPEQQANQKAKQSGQKKFQKRLDQGFTYAVDLCSGRSYKQSGVLPPGERPESPVVDRKDRDYLVNSNGIMHRDGMIFAGPFDPEQKLMAEVIVEDQSAPVSARLFCKDDARRLAAAYFDKRDLPELHPIAHMLVKAGQQHQISAPPESCASVLVLALEHPGSDEQPAKVTYSTFYEGAHLEPLAKCNGKAQGAQGSDGEHPEKGQ